MNDTDIRGIIQRAREHRAKWLNLSNRNLSELPPEIGELSDLQVLWLHGNRLTTLPPEIGKLHNLRRLRLHKNRLAELPPEIGHLVELRDLSVYSNQLTALPSEIGQLCKLQRLITANNEIQQLPKEIGQLAELLELNLGNQLRKRKKWGAYLGGSGNKLTELPPAIAQLQNLQSLYLSSNQLTELPPAIAQLQNLQSLSLDSNQLTELPPAIAQLQNLQSLSLDSNQLTELPPAIAQLQNLQRLWLNSNQLTELPPAIAQLQNLQSLSLDSNQLTELPPAIAQLQNLQRLWLNSNQLTELPPAIAQLQNLQSLYLSSNQLTELPPAIAQLQNLQELSLDSNQLTELPPAIAQLQNLQRLWLNSNQLTELPPAIAQLQNLQSLYLSSNQLTELPPAIAQLQNLQSLSLDSNQLTELPPAIAQLQNLQRLWLNSNQLTELPPAIAQLQNLQRLWLNSNQLTELPPAIAQLQNLQSLSLSSNQLTELPPAIAQLQNLQSLSLSSNQLTELPPAIAQLQNLQSLSLSSNQLTELPPAIAQLQNLQSLSLSSNQLTELPPAIAQLQNLQSLSLSSNQLTELPPAIAQLQNLQSLSLDSNQLTELPPAIAQLQNLQRLWLNSNQLTELPPAIAQLQNLQSLYLSSNQLTELPPAIAQLQNLQELSVSGNQSLRLAPEIVEGGTQEILSYLSHVKDSPKEWISKMLVVGEGAVGKTSLLKALRGEEFVKGLITTHGIETGTMTLAHPKLDGVAMQLNTWDFGGQQIYHATHQFFLTNRSLYVLVWNARMGFEQCKLHYWLDTIEARAPQSPILLVATHTDERKPGLPLTELQERYKQIIGHFEVSNRKNKGIESLKAAIAETAASLPLMGERWPGNWAKVRDALRKRRKRKKYIAPSEYDALMTRHKVEGIEERVLTKWLHELGEIIYFRETEEEDELLKETVILDSQWVTQAISQVLESDEVKRGLGLFTRPHMNGLWRRIETGMRDHLLRLMEKFDLSYRTLDNREISIVVERLDFDPPGDLESKWNGLAESPGEISMKFVLDKTMPAGIPTWFIARQHRFTTYTHWRYGALFVDESKRHWGLAQAFPHDRYLRLTVRGPAPHNFFALLRSGLELTLDRFKGLRVEKKIPCSTNSCPYEFELDHLERRLELKPPKLTIECPECLMDVPVPNLLVGIRFDTTYERLEQIHAEVKAARDEAIVARLEMLEITTLLQRELTSLFNAEQSKEESHCPYVYVLRDSSRGSQITGLLEPIRSAGTFEGLRERVWKGRLELQIYCQEPGCWHPLGYERGKDDPKTGLYQIEVSSDFLRTVGPYLVKLGKVMKYAQPVLGPWVSWATDEERYQKQFRENLRHAKDVSEALQSAVENPRTGDLKEGRDADRAGGAVLRALRQLLEEKDKQHVWGGLRAKLTKEGHWLWLCPHHHAEYND